jgi:GntR family transcriptional regulator
MSEVWHQMYYFGGSMATNLRPLKAVRVSLPIQTSQYIRELVESGEYQPGQQLPPEGDFARQLGISRPTLREALHSLELEGVIVCKHGVGTFIASNYGKRFENGLETLESIERIANRIGLQTQMGKAEIEERISTPAELTELGVAIHTQILSVARTILVDNKPVAYLLDILPVEYLRKEDLGDDFHGSILDMLLKRGRPPLAYSFTKLAAITAESSLARLLEIQPHTPLMRLEARLFTQGDQVVDYSISHFVPGFFDFHVVRRIGL